MTFPINATKEFDRRIQLVSVYARNPDLFIAAQNHYRRNCVDWINDVCITYDPRAQEPQPRIMPLVLFPRQAELARFILECFTDKANALVEKSRDMGASWVCCAISAWMFLYHDGVTVGWGSRKQEYVDNPGDMKAIFPKIRKILQYTPQIMLPPGFNIEKHSASMKIINPANNSMITGESGDNIGRGGRTSIYFKDESAHYERPELIEAALGDNTDVQVDISSVNGSANVFYRRRMAGQVWQPDAPPIEKGFTRVFVLDWRDHPAKTQAWHDLREAAAEREGLLHVFRQEVDRDYSGSLDKIIINPEWVRACIDAHIKLGFTDDGETMAAADIADGGADRNALVIRKGIVIKMLEESGGEADKWARYVIPLCIESGVKDLYYDSIGVGSGFKAETNRMNEAEQIPRDMRIHKWNAAGEVLNPDAPIMGDDDHNSPINKDFFENVKAQAWWAMMTRCFKTYRAVKMGEKYSPDELISIPSSCPRHLDLVTQLSQAVRKYSARGRVMVDKTPNGARSPNLADSAVMCYFPIREFSIFDALT